MKLLLEQLLNKEDLSFEIAFQTMSEIMSGNYTDIEISGFLIALRSKGESINEIAGFAKAMREKMIQVTLTKPAIDMCGTGGDSSGTFNISTASKSSLISSITLSFESFLFFKSFFVYDFSSEEFFLSLIVFTKLSNISDILNSNGNSF